MGGSEEADDDEARAEGDDENAAFERIVSSAHGSEADQAEAVRQELERSRKELVVSFNGEVNDADAFALALRASERDARLETLRNEKADEDLRLAKRLSLQEVEASAAKRMRLSEPGLQVLIDM